LGWDYPGGDARLVARRTINIPHKLPAEDSAQIPRVLVIFHLGRLN
jgi:hypothetical protein